MSETLYRITIRQALARQRGAVAHRHDGTPALLFRSHRQRFGLASFHPDRVPRRPPTKGRTVSLGTILLIVLILILLGVLPAWPHARSWGYAPSGIVGVVLVIVIVLFLMGRL